MNEPLVTKDILDVYDKYEGDFDLLHEPWAREENRMKVSLQQARVLSEYIDNLNLLKVDTLSSILRKSLETGTNDLEKSIDVGVVKLIKNRITASK